MSSRRTARKNAFLALYQSDVTGRRIGEVLERWRSYRGEFDEHAEKIARGVEKEREALDERLGEVAVGWPVYRMNAVDRTILRLALYEMLHVEDVPAEVAINEAEELAQGFSSEEAPQFVGGVLRGAKEVWLGDAGKEPERETDGEVERHDHRVEHG